MILDWANEGFFVIEGVEKIADDAKLTQFCCMLVVFSWMGVDFQNWLDLSDSVKDRFQAAKEVDS